MAYTTIARLVDALNSATSHQDFQTILDNTNLSIDELKKYKHFSNEMYTRNCIAETEHYQLILLGWNTGQSTLIHDHDGQAGWIKVIEGGVQEDLYTYPIANEKPKLVRTAQCFAGDLAHITDEIGLHRISNVYSDKKSVTMHLYVNPVKQAKLFDEETGEVEVKIPKYYSVDGELV